MHDLYERILWINFVQSYHAYNIMEWIQYMDPMIGNDRLNIVVVVVVVVVPTLVLNNSKSYKKNNK